MFLIAQTCLAFLLIRRVARKLQWGAEPPAAVGNAKPAFETFAFFWQKYLNFRPILVNVDAIKTRHRN